MNRTEPSPGSAAHVPDEAVRTQVGDLRRRMLLLARLLPVEHLRLLDADLGELESEALAAPLLDGLSDSVDLVASDVEPALRAAWTRAGGA